MCHCRTELHFVRCIKPNNEQAQEDYDAALVLHQLRCCGITEVARIARAGYPTRYAHQQFAQRYSSLLGNRMPREPLDSCVRGEYDALLNRQHLHCCTVIWRISGSLPMLLPAHPMADQHRRAASACHRSCIALPVRLSEAEGLCDVLKEICAVAGKGEPVLETCKQLLSNFGVKPEQYQIGRTKLFFRAGVLGQLEDAATRIHK